MAEQQLCEIVQKLHDEKKTGAVYVSVIETSEDLVRIYFKDGLINYIRYGTAVGEDCLDILEFYNFYSATYFEGISAPSKPAAKLPPTSEILVLLRKLDKKVNMK